MALIGEVVARFKAETSDYLAKIEEAKNKNRDLAKTLLDTAGSADKAIASLQVAKGKGALGDFGIDARQLSGIIGQIKQLDKELHTAKDDTDKLGKAFNDAAKRAGGFNDVGDSLKRFLSGDILGGIEKYKKGMADISELGSGGKLFKGAIAATAISMVGNALAEATGKAKDLVQQFRDGEISAGELADKLAGSLPVYGGIWQAGRNIREIFTGENAELEKQVKNANLLAAAVDKYAKAIMDLQKQKDKWKQGTEDKNEDTRIAGLKAAGLGGSADFASIRATADRELRSFTDEVTAQYKTTIETINGKIAAKAKNKQDTSGEYSQLAKLQKEMDGIIAARKAAIEAAANQSWGEKGGGMTAVQKDATDLGKRIAERIKDGLKQKGSPLVDWLKEQSERSIKAAEETKAKVDKLKEDSKSGLEKFADKIKEASVYLKGKDLDKYLTKSATDLQKEMKGLDLDPKRVYNVDAKEIRSGGTLYAPPSKVDEKSLERLGEIKEELKQLNEAAKQGGVVIEEISL